MAIGLTDDDLDFGELFAQREQRPPDTRTVEGHTTEAEPERAESSLARQLDATQELCKPVEERFDRRKQRGACRSQSHPARPTVQ